jgi:hypothetical protein
VLVRLPQGGKDKVAKGGQAGSTEGVFHLTADCQSPSKQVPDAKSCPCSHLQLTLANLTTCSL